MVVSGGIDFTQDAARTPDRGGQLSFTRRGDVRIGVYRLPKAAALSESLSQNHSFSDGNKRAGLTDAAFLIDLYETGRVRFTELDAWPSQACKSG
jgi:prophage maintenance system killer protein